MKKRFKKYLKKKRWVVALAIGSQTTALWPALYKVTKKQFSECLGDNFPVLAIR